MSHEIKNTHDLNIYNNIKESMENKEKYKNFPRKYTKNEAKEIIEYVIKNLPPLEIEFDQNQDLNLDILEDNFINMADSHFEICKIINYFIKCFNKVGINLFDHINNKDFEIKIPNYKKIDLIVNNTIKYLYTFCLYFFTREETLILINSYISNGENVHKGMINIVLYLYECEIKSGVNCDKIINAFNNFSNEVITIQYYTIMKLQINQPENQLYRIEQLLIKEPLFLNKIEISDIKDLSDIKEISDIKDISDIKEISNIKEINDIKEISDIKEININAIEELSELIKILSKNYGFYDNLNDLYHYIYKFKEYPLFPILGEKLLETLKYKKTKIINKNYDEVFNVSNSNIENTDLMKYLSKEFSKLMNCVDNYGYDDFLLCSHSLFEIKEKCSREHKIYTWFALILCNIFENVRSLDINFELREKHLWRNESIILTKKEIKKIEKNIKRVFTNVNDNKFRQFLLHLYDDC